MQLTHILSEEPEASLRGCAMLAAYGLRTIKDLKETTLTENQNNIIIKPDKFVAETYDAMQKEFDEMYLLLASRNAVRPRVPTGL